jgi:hypothetical protein
MITKFQLGFNGMVGLDKGGKGEKKCSFFSFFGNKAKRGLKVFSLANVASLNTIYNAGCPSNPRNMLG